MRLMIYLLPLLVLVSCGPGLEKCTVSGLRCEYLENPMGLDIPQPRLFWKMNKSAKGAAQTGYEILAATSKELLDKDSADLWKTGMVKSSQSIQVVYAGKPLGSGQKVFWKVRIWDEAGMLSGWSEVANWEMALLPQAIGEATWIGAPPVFATNSLKYAAPFFRKEVKLSKKIKQARAYISGLGYYELYINGSKAGDHVLAPNQTNYDRRQQEPFEETRAGNMGTTVLYETHDITTLLKQGENALGVILGNGWYRQADRPDDQRFLFDTPRFFARFIIDYDDGQQEVFNSDANWKTSLGPILYNGIHSGEIYDARKELTGWNEPGYTDIAWANAIEVRKPTGILKAQNAPPDRVIQTLKPISVRETGGAIRYDLGQMISGWARLKITGEKGTKIKLVFTEEFGPTYGQTDTYILKGQGTEIWEPRFTWHAFRYVDVIGASSKLTLENLEGRVVNAAVSPAGSFECSNELFNNILKNYRWTQLGNMHGGVPTDCPHRERRGYTGDGQISSQAAIYNFDMASFYGKWIADIRDGQNHKTGYVPNTTPYDGGGGGTPWGAAYIIIPWYMYQYYGDSSMLKQHYEGMKHWINFMKNSLNNKGILSNQGLGEWVPPDIVEIDPDYVNTCYYYWCTKLMAHIADVLHNPEDSKYFQQLFNKAANDLKQVYFHEDSAIYSVGRQGANTYPLGFGFATKETEDVIFEKLLEILLKNKLHFDTGILGTPLLLQVLTENGRPDLAYTLMNQRDFPSFGYMLEKGATTIWETFQGDVSHSHPMFGSVCEWFYKYLGGIVADPASPAFKHTIIKPWPVSGLDYVRTSYPSLYGLIKTDWTLNENDYNLSVTIPTNTTATVYVFSLNPAKITEGGTMVDNNKFVKFIRQEDNFSVFEVQSGTYQFSSAGARSLLKKTILPTPVISPSITYANDHDTVSVTIKTDAKDAKIYYTTNGSEPDSHSLVYEKPLRITAPTSLRAKALLSGFESSYTQKGYIGFINPQINGLRYQYYEGKWTKLPDFASIPVIRTGVVSALTLDKIIPTQDLFALVFDGFIKIDTIGSYDFFIQSNDGTRLYIDNTLVVDHDGPHGADIEKKGKIQLAKGLHPLRLQYFQAGGGLYLNVSVSGPGIEKQEVPPTMLFQK